MICIDTLQSCIKATNRCKVWKQISLLQMRKNGQKRQNLTTQGLLNNFKSAF
jgi:hypothetical protein